MNPLMRAIQRAEGAKWNADSQADPQADSPHEEAHGEDRRETPSPPTSSPSLPEQQPLSFGEQSVPDWSLAPITPSPPSSEGAQSTPRGSSIGESSSIAPERAREQANASPPAIGDAQEPESFSQSQTRVSGDGDVGDVDTGEPRSHGRAWEAKPVAKKPMARGGYKKLVLGVVSLLLSSMAAGAYVFWKVASHEPSYTTEDLPLLPIPAKSITAKPIPAQYAQATESKRSRAGFRDESPDALAATHSRGHGRAGGTLDKGVVRVAPRRAPDGAADSSGSAVRRFRKTYATSPFPEKPMENPVKAPVETPLQRPTKGSIRSERPEARQASTATWPQGISIETSMETSKDAPGRGNVMPEGQPGPIKITRTRVPDSLHATLMAGFDAFRKGDNAAATAAYRDVLRQRPDNRDALLGLAAVAMQKRQWEIAADYYLRILRRNPGDSVAQVALLGLQDNLDPIVGEGRIERLLAKQPNAAYLHFGLGNLYARQSRWLAAERAYFDAYRADEVNADYAYNLAVSLDHLGRRKAALGYYRRALDLAGEQSQPPGFDQAVVLQRIAAIEKQP
uniref:Tetratricopeptide repeat-containing protein n=1 Tax=Candidatus Kentrum sp. LFY TaxID=2126342 RepID=A0A450UMQ4_9GAMM|nr:MAG: Tetratricopeptide repeat-containing protein [Candidatus Kentron sp. LFY]